MQWFVTLFWFSVMVPLLDGTDSIFTCNKTLLPKGRISPKYKGFGAKYVM